MFKALFEEVLHEELSKPMLDVKELLFRVLSRIGEALDDEADASKLNQLDTSRTTLKDTKNK